LDMICTMFSQYCVTKFVVEQVEIEHGGTSLLTPNWNECRIVPVSTKYLSSKIGAEIEGTLAVGYLKRMQLPAVLDYKGDIVVTVPPLRSDIFHPCDILEDVAIGYGFNKLLSQATPPKTLSHGKQQPLEHLSNTLRREFAFVGWTEILTFSLCSHSDNYDKLLREDDNQAVLISNPINKDFQIVRTSLYPGLLHTIYHSSNLPLPLSIFEISDVMHLDPSVDVGAKNQRCACALRTNTLAEFEKIHGLLDRLMLVNRVLHVDEYVKWKTYVEKAKVDGTKVEGLAYSKYYQILPADDPMYLPNTCGKLVLTDTQADTKTVLGNLGIIHPKVLANFDITTPVSAFHINIEPLL